MKEELVKEITEDVMENTIEEGLDVAAEVVEPISTSGSDLKTKIIIGGVSLVLAGIGVGTYIYKKHKKNETEEGTEVKRGRKFTLLRGRQEEEEFEDDFEEDYDFDEDLDKEESNE